MYVINDLSILISGSLLLIRDLYHEEKSSQMQLSTSSPYAACMAYIDVASRVGQLLGAGS